VSEHIYKCAFVGSLYKCIKLKLVAMRVSLEPQ